MPTLKKDAAGGKLPLPPVRGDDLVALLSGRFHERLRQARMANEWSQSDLARRIWGEAEDSRGYIVAKNRDRVSAYEGRRATPTEANLIAMADLFGITPAQLAPDVVSDRNAEGSDGGSPTVQMRTVEGNPELVVLTINTITSIATAAEVVARLANDPVSAEEFGRAFGKAGPDAAG